MGSYSQARVPPIPGDHPIDDWRPIKCICVGVGMSGITVGAMLPKSVPNLELVLYEKNEDVGGSWYENRYPGVQPDLTPHTYHYTFASNPRWSRFYPPGAEFENYLKVVARKYGLYEKTKFGHKFQSAKWIADDGQWEITVLRLQDNTIIKDRAEIFIKATGLVNDWRWPEIPGREKFQGEMIHTANWDDSFDPAGKRVAIIGYGATGVQITPALQPLVKTLDHYVRGRVWVPPFGGTAGQELIDRGAKRNFDHPQDELEKFSSQPQTYLDFRKRIEQLCNDVQGFSVKDSEANIKFKQMLEASMKTTLGPKEGLYEAIRPDYPPGCRRIIMGQAWLECLVKPNANLITNGITRFTPSGKEDTDGTIRDYDAIICATGFDTRLDNKSTPIVGLDGARLDEVWDPEPVAYFSVAAPKMPNMFILFGPNSAPVAGSIVHVFEGATAYIAKCIKKIQQEYLKSMVVSDNAIAEWMRHVDYYVSKTVLSATCRTWFKRNIPDGRVIINWPGSAMHAYHGWRDPRFEDFEYSSWLPKGRLLEWLGNGMTFNEQNGGDTTDYMDFTDISTVLTDADFKDM